MWRLLYYGYPFPATYYLKMTGVSTLVRIQRGWDVFVPFVLSLKIYMLPFVFLALLLRRDRKTFLLLLIMLGWVAYSIYVGGDAWEHRGGANRFLSLGMPAYFTLFAITARELVRLGQKWISRLLPGLSRPAAVLVWAGFAALCLVGWMYPNRLNNQAGIRGMLSKWGLESPLAEALLFKPSIFVPGTVRYAVDGLMVRDFTDPQARVAVGAAGATIYFADRFGIDLMGKSDMVIAMETPPEPLTRETFRPGHNKYDYQRSLVELQPDVVTWLILEAIDEGQQILGDAYVKVKLNEHFMYLRKDSAHILWDRVQTYREP